MIICLYLLSQSVEWFLEYWRFDCTERILASIWNTIDVKVFHRLHFNYISHLQLVAFSAGQRCCLWPNRDSALCTVRSLSLVLESIDSIVMLDQIVWLHNGFLCINPNLLHSKQYNRLCWSKTCHYWFSNGSLASKHLQQ